MGQNESSVRPRDEEKEEINRLRAQLRQREEDYRFARFDKNGNSKNLVTSLRQRFSNLRRWGSQESESDSVLLEAARAVISEAGAAPLMNVVDKIQALHGEMEKTSDFLAQELRHSSYEIFQEELDGCRRESELIIGEGLSLFLVEVSEIDHLNQFLIKNVIQIFMVSFCEAQWEPYFNKRYPDPATTCIQRQSQNLEGLKDQFLKQLANLFKIAAWSIPDPKSRSAFKDSLVPFFKAMDNTKKALENLPGFAKVHLSVVGPDNDLSDSEICVMDTNITTGSEGTPDERLLQEFAQGRIIGTFGIGVYGSMREDRRFRNLLPKKVILSSVVVNQILLATSPRLPLPSSGVVSSVRTAARNTPAQPPTQPAAARSKLRRLSHSMASVAASSPKGWGPTPAPPPIQAPRSWASVAASNPEGWGAAVADSHGPAQLRSSDPAPPIVPSEKISSLNTPAPPPIHPRSWASLVASNPKGWGAAVAQQPHGPAQLRSSDPAPPSDSEPSNAVINYPLDGRDP